MKQRIGVFVLLLLCCSVTSRSQAPTAVVNGQVRDSLGGAIVGATVEVINDATAIRSTTETNAEGIYSVPDLQPGTYHIRVSKLGFKTVVHPDIVLNVQDARALAFTLPVGSVTETVTVEGGAPLINTESASVSTVVDRQFAENLPMNGRSFQTLIELTPGVVLTSTNGPDDGQFSVNGQRAASNYWMVDGVSASIGAGAANSHAGEGLGGALPGLSVQGGTNSLVSVDALQEFRIQTSTYAPEFGRTPGGQISIVTRSGANQFHGTAFDYFRNDKLDANDWFANYTGQPKPEERQNDFGGTFSGPILKDRTFFFFSYEGLRLRLPAVGLSVVPAVAARNAAIAATQPLLNAFPLPNGPEIFVQCDPATDPTCPSSGQKTTGTAQFNSSFSDASNLNATSLRIDYRLNDKLTLFGRYNYSPSELLSRRASVSLSELDRTANTIQTGTAGVTWSPSPVITNDLRFNYSRSSSDLTSILDTFGGAVPLSTSTLNFPSSFTLQNALFQVNMFDIGGFVDGLQGNFLQQQYNLVDSLSLQKGSHSLKFGVDYRQLKPSFNPWLYTPVFFFNDVPSTEMGQLFGSAVNSVRGVTMRLQNLGTFAQDTWRINPRLTLTYGLRWDLDFVPTSNPTFPAFSNFDLSNLSAVALAPSGTSPYSTTYGNFAPRVGIAYQVRQNQGWETVFRGGFGVFYDLATQELGNLLVTNQYPFGAFTFTSGGNYPPSSSQLAPVPISPPSPSAPGGADTFDPNLKLPYTLEWNVALEQGFGAHQTISASYVGSKGRRLLQGAGIPSPNSTFTVIHFITNAATSDYDALQLQFQRRLSRGLQVLSSYTWSHSIDSASAGSFFGNSANNLVPGLTSNINRGSSDFDIRNAFSAAATYEIPAPKINAFTKGVFGGWSVENVVQARSASPVNVWVSSRRFSFSQFRASTQVRPDIVPGQPLYLYGAQCASTLQASGALAPGQGCPGGKGFNPSAFMSPPTDANRNPTRQGNLPRNALRGFGATQWDLAIHRDFRIRESLKLQFRSELFNVLNHPNFGPPFGRLGSQFGVSTAMLGQSLAGPSGLGGFSPLYQIGGPRSVQFALKLVF